MPLPLILAGVAVASGIAGIKKGIDAKDTFERAGRRARNAQRSYEQAEEDFQEAEQNLKQEIEKYGNLKVSIYTDLMQNKFLPIYQKFSDVNLSKLPPEQRLNSSEVERIYGNVDIATKIIGGASESLFGGAAVGAGTAAGAWALAGSVGVASTGTAIGTLSGAAATNAAMAWLGGGALLYHSSYYFYNCR